MLSNRVSICAEACFAIVEVASVDGPGVIGQEKAINIKIMMSRYAGPAEGTGSFLGSRRAQDSAVDRRLSQAGATPFHLSIIFRRCQATFLSPGKCRPFKAA